MVGWSAHHYGCVILNALFITTKYSSSCLRILVIFAGFLLVHEAVLGPGGLDPVTGALEVGECALQPEGCDPTLVEDPNIIGCAKTKLVHCLRVTLKVVFEQDPLDGSFFSIDFFLFSFKDKIIYIV